jgi:hypothetical protein
MIGSFKRKTEEHDLKNSAPIVEIILISESNQYL